MHPRGVLIIEDGVERKSFTIPQLQWRSERESLIRQVPYKMLKEARDIEELHEAVATIVKDERFDADELESLILSLCSHVFYEKGPRDKLVEFYGHMALKTVAPICPRRAFRFLMSAWESSHSIDGTPRTPFLCHWDDKHINGLVKKNPELYFSHYRYRRDLERVLQDFIKDHQRTAEAPDRCFPKHDWERVERAIRRIVDAQDTTMMDLVGEIKQFHKDGRLVMDERLNPGDWALKPMNYAFLEEARLRLGVAHATELEGNELFAEEVQRWFKPSAYNLTKPVHDKVPKSQPYMTVPVMVTLELSGSSIPDNVRLNYQLNDECGSVVLIQGLITVLTRVSAGTHRLWLWFNDNEEARFTQYFTVLHTE